MPLSVSVTLLYGYTAAYVFDGWSNVVVSLPAIAEPSAAVCASKSAVATALISVSDRIIFTREGACAASLFVSGSSMYLG